MQPDIFGTIQPPPGVSNYVGNSTAKGAGLIIFASNLIKLFTLAMGLWVMVNFLIAGYTYITSKGDTSAHGKVRDRLTMSVIGLVLIVASYTASAIIGLIFFGDPSFILSPTIVGPN
jgi:hypothetical protein